MFTQNFVNLNRPLTEAHTDVGHFYKHNDTGETFISITTIFKLLDPKEWYQHWVNSVMKNQDLDEEEATKWCEKYSAESMKVGTALHNLAESYLNGNDTPVYELKTYEKSPYELFEYLKVWLDKNLKEVNATEGSMFSNDLKLAGTVDLVATLNDGRRVIIDFKNSRKKKTPGKIKESHYYEQMCAYGKMWEHMTGEKIETGIVLVVSWDGTVRPFEIKLDDYESSLMDWIIKYEEYKSLNTMK